MSKTTAFFSMVSFSLLAACTPSTPSRPTFSTRDSAGVIIAENGVGFLAEGEGWTVSAEPDLKIGALEGNEAYLFQTIWGASVLSNGRIAVVDTRAPNLRVFSAMGEHLHTFGRRGDGPGEFNSPILMGTLPGDTIVVVDRRHRRIDLFHPDHGFIRGATASSEFSGYLLVEGMFSSGTVLAQNMVFEEDSGNGYSRRKVHYYSVASNGTMENDLGEFVGEEVVTTTQTQGQRAMSYMGDAPFGKSAAVAVGGTRFYYGSQDSYEIQVRRQDGTLERIIRAQAESMPVTDVQVAALLESALEDLPDNDLARQYRRDFMDAPIPEFHPAFGELYLDQIGFLWVEESRASDDEPRLFSIFNPEGRRVAWVTLPDGLMIQEIGRDYILGRTTDELGVQYLAKYRLSRTS